MINSEKSKQHGFSLIEMLIVVVLLGLCLAAVVAFALRIQIASFAYNQKAEGGDRSKVITSQIKKDFENIGANLAYSERRGTSGAVSSNFNPHPDYSVGGDERSVTIQRRETNDDSYLVSSWMLVNGSGEISFSPNVREGIIGWNNPASENRAVYLTGDGEFSIIENGAEIFRRSNSDLDPIRSGDRFTISMNVDAAGNCSLAYYRRRAEDRQLLYKSRQNCPSYPLQTFIGISANDYLTDVNIQGSWFEPVADSQSPASKMPLLPTFRGKRLEKPIWITDKNQFSLLSTDTSIDPVALVNPVYFYSPNEKVEMSIGKPLRGEFAEGDICLLMNFAANKTVLGVLIYVQENKNSTVLQFLPSNEANLEDFGGFFSMPEDFIDQEFDNRSRLVRLNKPVNYQVISDEGTAGLILARREGLDPWENVAYGLTDFSIEERQSGGENIFYFKYDLAVEDSASTEPLTSELTVSPKALNLR